MKAQRLIPLLLVLFAAPIAVELLSSTSQQLEPTSVPKPSVMIAGVYFGMDDTEALGVLRDRYGLHADHHPIQLFELDGALVLIALSDTEPGVRWLASERLEVDGRVISSVESLPASLGTPVVVSPDDLPMCGDADSGLWFPVHSLLICKRRSGDLVFSLGDRDGWLRLPEGSTWPQIVEETPVTNRPGGL